MAAPIRLRLSYVSVIRALKPGPWEPKVAQYQASIHVLIGRNDGGHWALVSVEISAVGSDRSDPRLEQSILEAAYKYRCNHCLTVGFQIATGFTRTTGCRLTTRSPLTTAASDTYRLMKTSSHLHPLTISRKQITKDWLSNDTIRPQGRLLERYPTLFAFIMIAILLCRGVYRELGKSFLTLRRSRLVQYTVS